MIFRKKKHDKNRNHKEIIDDITCKTKSYTKHTHTHTPTRI